MNVVYALRVGASLLVILASALALAAPPSRAQPPSDNCPLAFTAVGHEDGSATFHWSGFGGADGYQVFGYQVTPTGRSNTAGYSPMLDGNARDWTQSNIATSDYNFSVTAFHSGSVVATSCERTIHVGPPQMAAPCPAPVTATAAGPSSVLVEWPSIPYATAYRVARQVDSGQLVHDYGAVPASSHPSFTDADAPPGHTYQYRVVSANTRYPPEVCAPVTFESAAVPFFPTSTGLAMGLLATLVAAVFIVRRR
jgi:hypothetical protein